MLKKLLTLWFRTVPVPPGLRSLYERKPCPTVVTQSRSVVVECLLRAMALKAGFTDVERCLHEPGTSEPDANQKILRWTSVSDEETLEGLIANDADHEFSTLNVFFRKGPIRSTPRYSYNRLELAGLLLGRRFVHVVFGEPIRLERLSEGGHRRVARELKLDFYRNLKMVRGTPFQSVKTQARVVFAGKEYERESKIIADRMELPLTEVHRRARRAFFRMAANPHKLVFVILDLLASLLIRRLFSQVQVNGLDSFMLTARDHPTVLVPVHRSHLDYILLSSVLYRSWLNPPLVAAGDNLDFWPVGFFIRRTGAFFIKRSGKGSLIDAMVLKRYVAYLMKRGHLQEFFIEGGRSRSGRMLPPKVGILKTLVDAWERGVRREVQFVPVSITYESIVEEKAFAKENTGEGKKKETFASLLGARKIFRSKYGEVVITFGAPVRASSFFGELEVRKGNGKNGKERSGQRSLNDLASHLTDKIRVQSPVSLSGLVYTALLNAPGYTLPRKVLIESVLQLSSSISLLREKDCTIGGFTGELERFVEGDTGLVEGIVRGGVVLRGEFCGETAFGIPGGRRFTADFYRNTTIHLFLYQGLLSILELIGEPLCDEHFVRMYELFRYDFLLPQQEQFLARMHQRIDCFVESNWLTREGNSLKFSDRRRGVFLPSLLISAVQSYLLVLDYICCTAPSEQFTVPNLIQKLQKDSKFLRRLGLFSRTEATSKANLESAVQGLKAARVISVTDKSKRIELQEKPLEQIELLLKINDAVQHWMLAEQQALLRDQFARSG